ncbi:hypothetical protein V6N13_058493 [Hibiscus sabdariffa]
MENSEKVQMVGKRRVGLHRVQGHVEEETLCNLQRCLVGFTASESDSFRIQDRLCSWGFGDISVKKLSGRYFLLAFKDVQLFKFLEELNWSYLKEVFVEVFPWTASFKIPERFVWLEITGLPIHCWNQVTFKRIASVWGNLEALGENANQVYELDRLKILISSSQMEKIEDVIIVEVGNGSFHVRISEISAPECISKVDTKAVSNADLKKTTVKISSSPP